jgi:YesN/AraC family two-component response regulator
MSRILLLDDEEPVILSLRRMLRQGLSAEVVVEGFSDPLTALRRAGEVIFDAVVSDYRMPVMNGLSWLREVKALQPDAARLLLSAVSDFHLLQTAINEGTIDRYLSKPWNDGELADALREAIELGRTRREQRRLADERRRELGTISDEEAERRRLEMLEPGITRVKWGPNGEVLLEGDADLSGNT